MTAFDTSFLLDYLHGDEAAQDFLTDYEDKPFFVPALALFEVYRGAARTGGGQGIDSVASALDWIEPLPLTDESVREAALVEAEPLDDGNRTNLADVLIAGVCRFHGARIVTRDDHFDRVADLDVITY